MIRSVESGAAQIGPAIISVPFAAMRKHRVTQLSESERPLMECPCLHRGWMYTIRAIEVIDHCHWTPLL